jgi:hypothetical protein
LRVFPPSHTFFRCPQNADIYAGKGGAGGPISCTTDMAVTELRIGGVWHGMEPFYMEGGMSRPDMQGLVCDGHETVNHNPFTTGWEWLGPGPRMIGVRQRMMDAMQKRCAEPGTSLARRIVQQCWFVDK